MVDSHLCGPYFMDGYMTAASYILRRMNCSSIYIVLLFQKDVDTHDETSPYFGREVTEYLNVNY